MRLMILDYVYQQSQAYLVQGSSRKKKRGRYIAGGNGSEIRGERAQVWVRLEDADTGATNDVDLYHCFKSLLDGEKLTQKRVDKIVKLYRERQPFEAYDWDDWEELSGLEKIV